VLLQVVDIRMESGDLQIKPDHQQHLPRNAELRVQPVCAESQTAVEKVTKLGNGKDTQLYIVPGADEFRGQELRLRARQIGGQRVLNYRWIVGENWDKPNASAQLGP
jgi:hypothetical protein